MRSTLLVLLALLVAGAASAQSELFERLERTSNGVTVKYGLYVPADYDPEVAYPLVMALHGAGERGSDYRNLTVGDAASNGLTTWATPQVQNEHPAFVLAPQVPSGLRWSAETDPTSSDFTPVQQTTLEILASVEAEYTIDPDRIYVVGLSMGGHGTWDFASRLPGRFAAAVPMSGEGFPSQAEDLLPLPIWAFTGEADGVVPAGETRRVIQRLEDLGRDVIYTHCQRSPIGASAFDCPGYIGSDSLAAALDANADLIYWSEPTVGHGPWGPWFRNGLMQDWLFSKVRQDPDAVAITAPASGDRWTGAETVTWTTTRTAEDTVEVWINPTDDPTGWKKVGEAGATVGALAVDTEAIVDAGLARVRLYVRTPADRIVGRTTSAPFALDNAGDAAPDLRLDTEALRFDPRLPAATYDLTFIAADAEGDALTAEAFYSVDGGATYVSLGATAILGSAEPQTISLDMAALPNSRTARLRLDLSDGTSTVSDETVSFLKQTPRDVNTFVQQVQGEGEGSVELHFVDEGALTNHRYRITLDTSGEAKTYSVTDLDEGTQVLTGIPLSDGIQESPVFDGIALVVTDLEESRADADATGWVVGDTDLAVAVSGGTTRISILTIQLLATETDYEIEIVDDVVGQSIRLYNIPVTDLRFTVTGGDGQPRDVVFVDGNDDGLPGDGDKLYLVEPNGDGDPALAWVLEFDATAGTVLPEAGDVFRLVPVRSLSGEDVFEFEGRFNTSVPVAPRGGLSLQTYPNPSTGPITLAYELTEAASVRLEVFDARGRLVATLADGPAGPGAHRTTWAAEAASGVFLVRLSAQSADGVTESVRQSVVLVRR